MVGDDVECTKKNDLRTKKTMSTLALRHDLRCPAGKPNVITTTLAYARREKNAKKIPGCLRTDERPTRSDTLRRKWLQPRSNIPLLKMIIWVTGVLTRTVVGDRRVRNLCRSHLHLTLKMASTQVIATSVANNSPC